MNPDRTKKIISKLIEKKTQQLEKAELWLAQREQKQSTTSDLDEKINTEKIKIESMQQLLESIDDFAGKKRLNLIIEQLRQRRKDYKKQLQSLKQQDKSDETGAAILNFENKIKMLKTQIAAKKEALDKVNG
ncbi:MAG: hypothetical protein H0W62_04010 [Chitinophagales bacterium]|nr:hypothetical protein [Chitinophagales bacterium]